eukprot:g2341.t1
MKIRVGDFESGSADLRLEILSGSGADSMKAVASLDVRFMHYKKCQTVNLNPVLKIHRQDSEGDRACRGNPRCNFQFQWCQRKRDREQRSMLLDYFIALDEARDEAMIQSLEETDLGRSTFTDNTLRIVKVFSCIVGFQNVVLETILWQRPLRCVAALFLWTACCVWPQIIFSLPALAIAFVLHLRLSGLRADDDHVDRRDNATRCTSCGRRGDDKEFRSCSGCGAKYCRVCKYLYMLREDRSKWSHVHCQRGQFRTLSDRPLSIMAHKRNARGMQNVMGEICDAVDHIDRLWHVGLRDAKWARKLQITALMSAPVLAALGRIVPFWIATMIAGQCLILIGSPLFRGILRFVCFWTSYESRAWTFGVAKDDTQTVDRYISNAMIDDDDENDAPTYKIVKEIQQWTMLSGWKHLAWDPNDLGNIEPPTGTKWSGLWSRETLDWEYTDGTLADTKRDVYRVESKSSMDRSEATSVASKRRVTALDADTEVMWSLAASRFAEPPFSNGKDSRYASVKAEIRGIYGHNAINDSNKSRLKYLAVSRGARLETSQYHSGLRKGDRYRRRVWKRWYCGT